MKIKIIIKTYIIEALAVFFFIIPFSDFFLYVNKQIEKLNLIITDYFQATIKKKKFTCVENIRYDL